MRRWEIAKRKRANVANGTFLFYFLALVGSEYRKEALGVGRKNKLENPQLDLEQCLKYQL